MWKLSEIKIRNIVSFREAELTFKQGVATLIFGKNEDNASQPCNGSGKSSLVEAVSFALTGEQLRKVKSIEEIINDSEEEAYVYMRLDNDYDETTFTIERTISRNSPQVIECHKYAYSGEEIETDKTVQPSVSDYNKFILGEIGLTKDDIYNNYILCDNKYEGFFDCSDKDKKETINRFSNGVIVDESIERLHKDMEPAELRLSEANLKVTGIKGSISAIESELNGADEKRENAKKEREQRIRHLDDKILQCRNEIEALEERKRKGAERMSELESLREKVSELGEEADSSLLESYRKIRSMCVTYELGTISDYDQISQSYKQRLNAQKELSKEIEAKLVRSSVLLQQKKAEYQKYYDMNRQHIADESRLSAKDNELKEKINAEIDKIDAQLDKIEDSINANKKRQAELETLIARNVALMDGVIVCPKCQHKFFLDGQISVAEVSRQLAALRAEMEENKKEVGKLNEDFDSIDKKAVKKSEEVRNLDKLIKSRQLDLDREYKELRSLSALVDEAGDTQSKLQRQLNEARNEIDRLNGKVEVLRNRLFGEIEGIIDGRIMNGKNYLQQQEDSIVFTKSQIRQYQQSKKELQEATDVDFASSLKASLKKYQSELNEAESAVCVAKAEYDRLKEQEVNFTMFKSYIARKKIDALSLIVNDFLEKIGSDIRLRLEGFTVTKTGKLRDKISVQVMRDGIDCGSYHKFSGGEKARLNLACILSLHTLTNSNCEDGKGLDFIIIDELLDKSDEVGMATYCEALNKLGQTSLLITQGGVAEGYPHKLLVVKKQGVSTISI